MKRLYSAFLFAALALPCVKADRILHIPMDFNAAGDFAGNTNVDLDYFGQFAPETVKGAAGNAWRLDGYTSYAEGTLDRGALNQTGDATFSVWVAPETYPIIEHDVASTAKTAIVSTINETSRAGWEFNLGYTGKYGFSCYAGSNRVNIEASDLLPCYQWSKLTAVYSEADAKITLYRDGEKVGEAAATGTLNNSSSRITVGKSFEHKTFNNEGQFLINTVNGLIDDIEVYNEALVPTSAQPENDPDYSVAATRFENDSFRPKYHGMPAAGWTNETHGMTYYNGKFHLFFQKNANGPYMSRLHWGHLSSTDMVNWTEEKIAIAPGDETDVKGCWSGCVVVDQTITRGKPYIYYTGVDYARAYIKQATPDDEDLLSWTKRATPVINGAPAGLSDDFRDPYFFRNGNNAYMIVGTARKGIGAVTLHKYNLGSFTRGDATADGSDYIFFEGTSTATAGTFWEMPTVTQFGDKWLFTTTPQNTADGVKVIYWTGTIDDKGKFNPDYTAPRQLELISKQGYGLLSPTVINYDGKTIALGIVPDKLPGSRNAELGWAHTYSFPREWSLDNEGNLVQKPFSGLANIRSANSRTELTDVTLNGPHQLDKVGGNHMELLGEFTVGNGDFGFSFLKNGADCAKLTYSPASNKLEVDLTQLSRISNDGGAYDGLYSCTLPVKPAAGSTMKLNIFIDGSVLDIFVNDTWATSIRVFPSNPESSTAEAFGDNVKATSLQAWNLDGETTSIFGPWQDKVEDENPFVDVVSLSGTVLKTGVAREKALDGLSQGIYIVGGKKVIVNR